MNPRETIVEELWKRLQSVAGVVYTARNPSLVPTDQQLPAIQFFELTDVVDKADSRGGVPIYVRKLTVVVESFINATSEPSASKEIMAFVDKVKLAVYSGGPTLGKRCSLIRETEMSRVLRPKVGERVVGLGVVFEIMYIEDVSKLT